MANARVSRGRKSQELLRDWFISHGWSNAKSRPASLPGTDIYDMPGLAPEVKATAGQDFTGALRQAKANAGTDPCDFHKEATGSVSADCPDCTHELPFVVYRPAGYGPERISQWIVAFSLADATELLKKAGYQ